MLPDPTSSSSNHKTRTLNLLPLLPCHYSSLLAESCCLGICLLLHHFSGASGADPPSDVLDTRQRCDRLKPTKSPLSYSYFCPSLFFSLQFFSKNAQASRFVLAKHAHTYISKRKTIKIGYSLQSPMRPMELLLIGAYPNAKISRQA